MKKLVIWLCLTPGIPFHLFAQTGSISGTVKDAETGEPLSFCNVFVNNTILSTAADMDGKFALTGLEEESGMKEFVVEGYQPAGSFFTMDYDQITQTIEKDDRQTLYWNPYLICR
jgi:hypothetical protein